MSSLPDTSAGGQYYEQTDGVAVGSPPSTIIMDFLVEDFEEMALEQTTRKPLCWFRYVDGNFVIWPRVAEKLERFVDSLIVIHRNINSNTVAKYGHLPFLDIEIQRRVDGSLGHKALLSTLHTSGHSHLTRLPLLKLSFDFHFHFLHLLRYISIFFSILLDIHFFPWFYLLMLSVLYFSLRIHFLHVYWLHLPRLFGLRAPLFQLDFIPPSRFTLRFINPLALELDIYSLAHHLCKMWIFYEPRRVTLGNKRHFVEEQTKMMRESPKK